MRFVEMRDYMLNRYLSCIFANQSRRPPKTSNKFRFSKFIRFVSCSLVDAEWNSLRMQNIGNVNGEGEMVGIVREV